MEILEKALNLTSRYGISLHRFGPFLSFVDNKIGICLDIKDDNYGFLTRNYSFENLDDFEEFIKKYSYYKNTIKGNTKITLDDYKILSPKIKYGFEEKKLIEKENEQKEIFAIKNASDSLYLYLETLYNKRIEELEKRYDIFKMMNNNLNQYKRSLYAFYNKDYQEGPEQNDDFLNNYTIKGKRYLNSFKANIYKLKEKKDLKQVKEEIRNLVQLAKAFELDQDYYGAIYELYLFKNKSYILEQMNNHILKILNSEIQITPQELKSELEEIKNRVKFSNSKDIFVKDKLDALEEKYSGISNLKEYNIGNYLKNEEFIELDFIKYDDTRIDDKFLDVLNNDYNGLRDIEKNYLLILFSPFGKIINQMVSNQLDDYEIYKDFYLDILEYLNIPENLIFKRKHFNLIDFNNFESFINSLREISKNIHGITLKASYDSLVWAYPSKMDLIYANLNVLKSYDNIVDCFQLKIGTNIFYSAKKIRLVNDKFIIDDNKNIYIRKDNNIINVIDQVDEINNYKASVKNININDKIIPVAESVEKIGVYKYKNYNVEANVNE